MQSVEARFVDQGLSELAKDLSGHRRILVVCGASRRFANIVAEALAFAEVQVSEDRLAPGYRLASSGTPTAIRLLSTQAAPS